MPAPPAPPAQPAESAQTGPGRATRTAPNRPRPPWWAFLLAGVLYAAAIIAAFPPVGLPAAIVLALAPLAWAALNAGPRALRPALWVAVGSAPAGAWTMRFLIDVTAAGYPGLVAYLAVYAGVFVFVASKLDRRLPSWIPRAIVFAALFSTIEILRGEVILQGLPWFLLSQPLIDFRPAAAAAAWVGVYGVSALVGLATLGVTLAALRPRRWIEPASAASVVLAIGAHALYWWSPAPPAGARTIRVALVQTSLPQSNKMAWTIVRKLADFARFIELTRDAAKPGPDGRGPDVIVWPETMFPGFALNSPAVQAERDAQLAFRLPPVAGASEGKSLPTTFFHDKLTTTQAELAIPILVGGLAAENVRVTPREGGGIDVKDDARFNSVVLVDGGIVLEARYDKMVLTPFGEIIPWLSALPALQQFVLNLGAAGMSFDLAHGQSPTVFEFATADGRRVRAVTPICFEATVPWVCRRLAYGATGSERRADLLVSPSNDGWFGRFAGGREFHLLFARWRCAELGLPMVRAVNTGVSSSIDPAGRLVATFGPNDHDGVLTVDVPVAAPEASTFYARHGDVAAWSGVAFTGLVILLAALRRATPVP